MLSMVWVGVMRCSLAAWPRRPVTMHPCRAGALDRAFRKVCRFTIYSGGGPRLHSRIPYGRTVVGAPEREARLGHLLQRRVLGALAHLVASRGRDARGARPRRRARRHLPPAVRGTGIRRDPAWGTDRSGRGRPDHVPAGRRALAGRGRPAANGRDRARPARRRQSRAAVVARGWRRTDEP